MNKASKTSGMIAMTAVVLIYGVSYISREAIGSALSAPQVLVIQMTIMAAFFGIYNLVTRKSFALKKKDIVWVIASGLFGTTFFHGFTLLSVNSLGATVSSLLYGFAAAFALVVEILLYHRKKTVLGIASILVSLTGIFILMDMDLESLASTNFTGYLLGLASVASWVTYTFLCDKITGDYPQTILLSYQSLVGVVTTIPLLLTGSLSLAGLSDPMILVHVLFLGLFNSSIAYFLNMFAIRRIGVTLSNLFLNFLPVVTMLMGIVLYGTMPSAKQIIGGALVIVSVFMLNKDQKNLDSAQSAQKENAK